MDWISVKDRLPKSMEVVIATEEGYPGACHVAYFTRWNADLGIWQEFDNEETCWIAVYDPVTYWRPMLKPAPPSSD